MAKPFYQFTSPLRLLYRLADALPPRPSPQVPFGDAIASPRAQVCRLFSPLRAIVASHPF